ncbi:Hypothetical protein SRAE_1000343400 [Strongyloides ratti]|uniref:Uncharacterized protein n=1 Tax=Strongyloides ratti TaxID=34506 RepID=A0A090L5Z1_STRRB|nr:Hypothetical protein SRAE_1000343400 [Strongyloides ratti]CEF65181.1 Hypothetical protein SRAE_1000343400 [Strongyloides ratti]
MITRPDLSSNNNGDNNDLSETKNNENQTNDCSNSSSETVERRSGPEGEEVNHSNENSQNNQNSVVESNGNIFNLQTDSIQEPLPSVQATVQTSTSDLINNHNYNQHQYQHQQHNIIYGSRIPDFECQINPYLPFHRHDSRYILELPNSMGFRCRICNQIFDSMYQRISNNINPPGNNNNFQGRSNNINHIHNINNDPNGVPNSLHFMASQQQNNLVNRTYQNNCFHQVRNINLDRRRFVNIHSSENPIREQYQNIGNNNIPINRIRPLNNNSPTYNNLPTNSGHPNYNVPQSGPVRNNRNRIIFNRRVRRDEDSIFRRTIRRNDIDINISRIFNEHRSEMNEHVVQVFESIINYIHQQDRRLMDIVDNIATILPPVNRNGTRRGRNTLENTNQQDDDSFDETDGDE